MRYISIILLVAIAIISGCSANSGVAPVMEPSTEITHNTGSADTHTLLGFWQGRIDPASQTIEFTPMRETSLHLNALPFLEPPVNLNLTLESVQFNGNIITADIGLRHPFTTMTEFTGFDVSGIFLAKGSKSGYTDTDIRMSADGDTRLLNPDGYSRWWNPVEFPINNGTMFSYTDGLLGTPDSSANFDATLNGYKYYCDDLNDITDTLSDVTLANRGMFSSGQKNIRRYIIELGQGLIFNYAVDASWQFPTGAPPYTAPDDFGPDANRPEAWNISVTEISNTLWYDGVGSGGDLNLSIDVYDWSNADLDSVRVEYPGDFIMVESSTPTGGGPGYSTYTIDILSASPVEPSIDLLISVASDKVGYGGLLPGKTVTSYFTYNAAVDDQAPVTTSGWARSWGSTYQDRGYAVCVDSEHNIYVAGNYYYSVDFDPGPGEEIHNSNGNRDTFVSKFDQDGNFLWVRVRDDNLSYGGSANDITCDSDNNIYFVGHFFGNNVDFDPGPGTDYHTDNGGGGDPYLTALTSDGDFLWARTWDSNEDSLASWALGVSVDSAHNVYAAGDWWGSGDFDPGPGVDIKSTNGEQWDAFISKFNSTGDYQWGRMIGSTSFDFGYGCAVDANDEVYVTGVYNGSVDSDRSVGDDTHNASTEGNDFLWKLDADGNHLWSRVFGKGYTFRVRVNSANNIYVRGSYSGTAQFDPDGGTALLSSSGVTDDFYNVFADNGDWVSVATWGSIATGSSGPSYVGTSLWIDSSDNIYVGGSLAGTVDVDPGAGVEERTSNGGIDGYVMKLDPSGGFIWCNSFGGTSEDETTAVSVDNATGGVYATGWFLDQCDFDPGPGEDIHIDHGILDAFLVRYKPDGTW